MAWLSGAFSQSRPYRIYVVGPDDFTSRLFFNGVRTNIGALSNSSGDQIERRNDDVEGVFTNSFTVIRQPRLPTEAVERYSLTNDPAPVVATGAVRKAFTDNIDAYVVAFRIDNADDFEILYNKYLDLVVALCTEQYSPSEPRKVIVLAANRAQVYSTVQGFHEDDMRALMRRTHAAYRYANFNNSNDCGALMDMVVSQTIAAHRDHRLAQQATLPVGRPPGPFIDSGSLLSAMSGYLAGMQQRVFPHCAPDLDGPTDMREEDKPYHKLGMGREAPPPAVTPMGMPLDTAGH